MQLRRYCVTVMDNWTPTKSFWTRKGALLWAAKHSGAHVFKLGKREPWMKLRPWEPVNREIPIRRPSLT